MSELASLAIKIDASSADPAAAALDKLAGSSGRAEKATDSLSGSTRRASSATETMLASIERGVRDLVAMGQAQLIMAQHTQQAAGAVQQLDTHVVAHTAHLRAAAEAVKQQDAHVVAHTAHLKALAAAAAGANDTVGAMPAIHGRASASTKALQQSTLNMTRQFADVGVTAAMGMNPLMILIQQGPQIADSFQVASHAGLGFKAVMAGLVSQLGLVTVAGGAVAASQFAAAEAAVADAVAKNAAAISAAKLAAAELASATAAGAGVEAQTALAIATARDTLAKEAATAAATQLTVANAGLATSATAVGTATTFAMGPVLAVLLAVAAAAALIALPFAVAAQQIGAANKGMINELGLTEKQIAKVKDAGTTMGDVLTGTWVATSKALTEAFGPEIEAVSEWFGNLYQGTVDGAFNAIKAIVGGFTGAFAAVKATWRMLPAALGDAAYSAANLVLRGISMMINSGVGLLNGLIAKANSVASKIPGLDVLIPSLTPVAVMALSNPFAGAMAQLGEEGATAFAGGYERGSARVVSAAARVQAEIEAAQRRRIIREAGDAGGSDAGGSASRQRQAREVEEIQRLWSDVNVEVRDLNIQLPQILDPLDLAIRRLSEVDDLVRSAGRGMEESFGRAGRALAGLAEGLSGYRLQMAQIAKDEASGKLWDDEAIRARGAVEIQTYGDMASAAKSFFGEKTAAYKALQGIEMAYRALQFANSIRAMALDTAETGSSIGNSLARGAAKAAEAVAGIFAKLGPFGFPVAAAALAVMASVGLRGLGGGGGGSTPTMPTTNEGRGTVLGNGSDQSASLGNSMDLAERYWNKDLEFSNKQLTSLKAIQANIGSLTTAIAKEMNVGGGLDPTGLNQGPTTSGGFLGAFSTTRSSNVVGSGINLSGGQLADLIANGVSGALYQIVQTTRTNSGFFGIGASTRTTNSEVTTGIDQGLSQEFSRVLASLRDGVLTAAGELGLTGAEAVLDAFQVNLGRISFEGMSSSEINDTLNAVFSAVGDDMARAILPGLDAFQRAGEGLLETLSRLATEYRTVDVTLQSIGMTFGAVGLSSIEARTRLVELVGGLDAFTEGASFFAENFLTEAQRIAPVQAAVTAELTRLGLATDITRTQFADLVMGLDVSTTAGAEMFAALMRLAPALDQTLRYTEDMVGGVVDAVDLSNQRRQLEISLMEATGDTAGALAARRAAELAAMDASLRPLQEQIYAALDLAEATRAATAAQEEAARAAADLAAQRRDLEIQLMEAQGDAAGALAARRALEVAALDETLRPLQLAIYAALDLAAAADALAQAQADAAAAAEEAARAAAALASQRRDLEIDLMDATGNAAGALAARRQLELEALDASLRPLQEAIYAAQDLATAADALATAQAAAAQAAEAEAQRVAQIASTRRDLEVQLMDAQGRSADAVAARRAMELEALDASLRPLQEAIYAALDLAAAADALATAAADAAAAAEAEADRLAQIASQRADLQIQLMEAEGRSSEALAARRALEIAALNESLRPLQEAIFAALDLAAAAQALADAQAEAARIAEEAAEQAARISNQRRDLEIQLMDAQGNASGALAARRADEIAALDASLRPIQRAIWAAQDLAAANQVAAQAQRDAAQAAEQAAQAARAIATQQRTLEIQLMDATGNAAGALAARRADELAALDPTLRALQSQIWAALDLAAATDAATQAQQQAADAARAIVAQQRSLDIQLMEATGNASGALAARRADELAAMDQSLRATQQAVWAALDLAAANEQAATAQAQAADQARALAAQRRSLEIALMEATGDSTGALAARRADEVAALDESLRSIQLAIYAAQDLAAANQAAAEAAAAAAQAAEESAAAYRKLQDEAVSRVNDARSNLTSAYEREAEALKGTIKTFGDFGASIREFRDNLGGASGSTSYAASRAKFQQTAAMAQLGNQDALGGLTGASQAFLDAALNNASSAAAYNRDVALVRAALDAAAGTADRTVSVAEQQLAQLDASVSGLIAINESVLSVRDGILALQAAITDAGRLGVTQFASGGVFTSPTNFRMGSRMGQMAEAGPEAIMPLVSGPNGLGVRASGGNDNAELVDEIRALRQEVAQLRSAGDRTATASEKTAKTLVRVTRDGDAMLTEVA